MVVIEKKTHPSSIARVLGGTKMHSNLEIVSKVLVAINNPSKLYIFS